jgi:hypothetical protein
MRSRLAATILALSFPTVSLAAAEVPSVSVSAEAVVVSLADQTLTVSLTDGELRLASPQGDCVLTPSLQLGEGWTKPAKATLKPRVSTDARGLEVQITYPVPEEREFSLRVEARRGIVGFFVTSRLKVLTGTRGQYYYWQTNLHPDRYSTPGPEAVREIPFRLKEWDPIPWREWWYLPGVTGGIVVMPTNVAGRCPGETGGVFLHALPRSDTLCPGESLDAHFGLAGAKDANAAAALSARARGAGIAALDPCAEARRPSGVVYGAPAPKWLREAEVYNLYYRSAADWTDEVVRTRLAGFPFISGSTPDRAALDRCHKAGVKLTHYVVYTCLLDTAMQVREGGKVYSEWSESLDNETRDLKDHPEWVCIDAKGNVQKDAWGQAHGHPGLLNTCLHQQGLHDAAVRQVKMLMGLGYDGVFIDLAGPTVECYGPKFGKHAHPEGAKTNTEAYQALLREVYRAAKSSSSDRIVIQNTCTATQASQWSYTDAQMLEAFPYGEGSGDLRSTWPEMQWIAARNAEAVKRGKVVVLLPYFGGAPPEKLKQGALLSFAYAQMSGFLWADALTLEAVKGCETFARELYRTRLGKRTAETRRAGEALYCVFERGITVVNPTPETVSMAVPVSGSRPLRDVGYGRELQPVAGKVTLELPGESGRILIARP